MEMQYYLPTFCRAFMFIFLSNPLCCRSFADFCGNCYSPAGLFYSCFCITKFLLITIYIFTLIYRTYVCIILHLHIFYYFSLFCIKSTFRFAHAYILFFPIHLSVFFHYKFNLTFQHFFILEHFSERHILRAVYTSASVAVAATMYARMNGTKRMYVC